MRKKLWLAMALVFGLVFVFSGSSAYGTCSADDDYDNGSHVRAGVRMSYNDGHVRAGFDIGYRDGYRYRYKPYHGHHHRHGGKVLYKKLRRVEKRIYKIEKKLHQIHRKMHRRHLSHRNYRRLRRIQAEYERDLERLIRKAKRLRRGLYR